MADEAKPEVAGGASEKDIAKEIASGLKSRQDSRTSPADDAEKRIGEADKAAVDAKSADDKEASDENAALRKRIEELEANEKKRSEKLEGEYAKARYMQKFPPALFPLLDKWLPVVTNEEKLYEAHRELETVLKVYTDAMVASGQMRYVNFGGANREGGMTPNQQPKVDPSTATAASLIRQGFKR